MHDRVYVGGGAYVCVRESERERISLSDTAFTVISVRAVLSARDGREKKGTQPSRDGQMSDRGRRDVCFS